MLAKLVVEGGHSFKQPIWVLNAGNRIRHLLHGGGDGDQLLNDRAHPLYIILPIEDGSQIEVGKAVVLQPLPQVSPFYTFLR
jgi:hypothetical protein